MLLVTKHEQTHQLADRIFRDHKFNTNLEYKERWMNKVNEKFYNNDISSRRFLKTKAFPANISTLFLGWYNVVISDRVKSTFDADLNNVRQRQNNVLIFNVNFLNIGQRRNNFVNMAICIKLKNKLQAKNIIFLSFK